MAGYLEIQKEGTIKAHAFHAHGDDARKGNGVINFFKDNFTFLGVDIETSNDYVKLFAEAEKRFAYRLSVFDDEVKRYSNMLRYSADGGQTFGEIDCLIGNINDFEPDRLYSSADFGMTFTQNADTTNRYIDKINAAVKKRYAFISANTTSDSPYSVNYDTQGKNRLYSDKAFPFTDDWSKNCIEVIKRNAGNKKWRILKDCFLYIWGTLGSACSIISLFRS
jgi:hypothetical protein